MSNPRDDVARLAAWMRMRAQSLAAEWQERERASQYRTWLEYWLSPTAPGLDAATATFLTACAEEEMRGLIGGRRRL